MSPGDIYLMEIVQKQCESEASEASDLFFLILKAVNQVKSQQACVLACMLFRFSSTQTKKIS